MQEGKAIQFINFDEKNNISLTKEAKEFLLSLNEEQKLG